MNPFLVVFGVACFAATINYALHLNPMGFASGVACFLLLAAAWVDYFDPS